MNVSLNLVKWYNKNKRELPWRHTDNPYFIWLSEIILNKQEFRMELNTIWNLSELFQQSIF